MITDPKIVKFSAEQARVMADMVESAMQTIETFLQRYSVTGIEATLNGLSTPEKMDTIDDRATEEGRPVYSPAYIINYANNLKTLIEQLKAVDPVSGWTMRQQMGYMATNIRNPLVNR